jgi:hypothetical protein
LEPEQILRGAVPPFVVALILLLPLVRRGGAAGRDSASGASGAPGVGALGALALGLGALAGTGFVVGAVEPLLHPVSVQHKLAWAALAAALFGLVDQALGTRGPGRIAVRTVLRFALPAGFLWWFLATRRQHVWSTAEAWAWTSAFAAAIAVLATGIDLLAARRPGPSVPLALCAALAVAGGALVAGRTAAYGQIAGTMSAALGAAVVVALLHPGLSLRGAGVPVALFLGCLVLAGHTTGELAARTAIAVFAAPLAPALVELVPLRAHPRAAGALRVVLAALPGLVLVWMTYEAPAAGYY